MARTRLRPTAICCRRLRGSGGGGASFSMGLRPRLSAAAPSRLDSNPRALARYMFSRASARQGWGPARGQTGVSQRVPVGFLRSRRPDTPHRISLRLAARLLRLPLKGGVIALGARASRPHPVPLVAAELQCDAAGSHPVGGNCIGQAEGSHGAVPGRSKWGR